MDTNSLHYMDTDVCRLPSYISLMNSSPEMDADSLHYMDTDICRLPSYISLMNSSPDVAVCSSPSNVSFGLLVVPKLPVFPVRMPCLKSDSP